MAYMNAGTVSFGTGPEMYHIVQYELVEREVSIVRIRLRVYTYLVIKTSATRYGYVITGQPTINGATQNAQTIKAQTPDRWTTPIETYFPSSTGYYETTVEDLSATSMAFSIGFVGHGSPYRYGSGSFAAALPNLAPSNISSDVNFNIGSDLVVAIERQSPDFTHTLRLYAGSTLLSTLTNVGASAAFPTAQMASQLYALTPNASELAVLVECETFSGASSLGTTSKTGSAYVTNSEPAFTDFAAACDSATNALTGVTNKVIKGYSTVNFSVPSANRATARNGAAMASYNFGAGSGTASAAYSAGNVTAAVANADGAGIFAEAVDSRGLKTRVERQLVLIDYAPIVLKTILLERDNDVDPEVKLTYTGALWAESFGVAQNAVMSASYRYKRVKGDTWTNGTSAITPTTDANGNISFSGYIVSAVTDWASDQAYDVEITLTDRMSSATLAGTINTGIPGIFMKKVGDAYRVGIGKVPGEHTLDVNGEIAAGAISAASLALAAALPIASGGTGAADATAARTNILTALKPKKLWSGNFAGGTITVPGLSDYALVACTCASDPGIWMIGSNGTYGAIFGLYQGAGISAMYCRCNQSGNSLTIDGNFRGAGYYNGGSYPSALTAIWGLLLKSDVTGGV